MFKPLAMQRLSLKLLREDAPAGAAVLGGLGVFNPETADLPADRLREFPAARYREVYSSVCARLAKIANRLDCRLELEPIEPRVVELSELEELDERVGELWREVSKLEETRRERSEALNWVDQRRASLEKFRDLDIDLGLLQRPRTFLSLHVGTIPRANRRQLEQAVALAGHVANCFHSGGDIDHVIVAGPAAPGQDIEGVLHAAEFRATPIPPEFRDYPDKINRELTEQRAELERALRELDDRCRELTVRLEPELRRARSTLAMAAPYAELATELRGQGGLAVVEGWAPKRSVPALLGALHQRLRRPFVLDVRDPLPAERAHVPSLIKHSRFMRPFGALVKNYGVPRYGEIDPTLLLAFTFTAMFGMMFGDLGHGAVIAVAGLGLAKRFPVAAPFLVGAGIASMGFGVLYGSVFGYEELIHPLWVAPLSDPMLMLTVALVWGIGFILVANALTVYNLLGERRFGDALFDSRGLAGIAFYVAGVYGAYSWIEHGVFGVRELAALLLPLALIIAYTWRQQSGAPGERALVALIEGFESCLGYFSNTLSFLRVAAFSLNHVALAIAVFTLANGLGESGYWVMVVLGNIFIIALEGTIVGIQALRLEYYEGFSRFFSGDGREFRPLKLTLDSEFKA